MSEEINKKFFDPSFHLLEKFRDMAPGTHKHCQNVANICESVAVELGLNTDLIKCAALYHDIGKMNNPKYFSENQGDSSNPHNDITPEMSYLIVTKHVGDSVLHLLDVEDMPRDVIKIVSQHHGNSVLQAFFNKAKDDIEDHFRYRCSKPKTTEASVLMIVDSVEAMARALYNSKSDEEDAVSGFINKAINGTIDRLVEDQQLDSMQIGVLRTVKKILFKELESTYHKRVSYESDSSKEKKE